LSARKTIGNLKPLEPRVHERKVLEVKVRERKAPEVIRLPLRAMIHRPARPAVEVAILTMATAAGIMTTDREIKTATVALAVATTTPAAEAMQIAAVAVTMPRRGAQTPIDRRGMTTSIPACAARWRAMAVAIGAIGLARRRTGK
jgi:hypothetical protein